MSLMNISSAEVSEDYSGENISIKYKNKIGFFISPFRLKHYHKAVSNIIPKLEKDYNDMKAWKNEYKLLYETMHNKYYKLKAKYSIAISFGIGGCIMSFSILTGIIVYAILNYYNTF